MCVDFFEKKKALLTNAISQKKKFPVSHNASTRGERRREAGETEKYNKISIRWGVGGGGVHSKDCITS